MAAVFPGAAMRSNQVAGRPFRRWAPLFTACLIIAAMVGYSHWADTNPVVVIPARPKIAHNAFDNYLHAISLLKRSADISLATDPSTSPSPADLNTLVSENEPALQAIRQGLTKEYMQPGIRSFSAALPYLAGYRSLARLMLLDGQVKASQGDWSGMVDDDLDIVRFGIQIPRGGPLISYLVGEAVEAIGTVNMERALPHLSAGDALRAANTLEALDAQRQPMSVTFREEKWGTEASLLQQFQKPAWRWQFAEEMAPNADHSTGYLVGLRLLRYSKQEIVADFDHYMNQCIANSELPYGAPQPVVAQPNDPVGQILAPVYTQASFTYFRQESRRSMLITALALHAYHLQNHAYPTTLQELVEPGTHGQCLSHLPVDPFAPDGALRYRLNGADYLLYSVGPDRIDDNGDSFKNDVAQGGHAPRVVTPDSRGDILYTGQH